MQRVTIHGSYFQFTGTMGNSQEKREFGYKINMKKRNLSLWGIETISQENHKELIRITVLENEKLVQI